MMLATNWYTTIMAVWAYTLIAAATCIEYNNNGQQLP
jgi:hypothetical protein